MNNQDFTDKFLTVTSVAVPVSLILLSILTPKNLVSENQKETLLTAGITLLLPSGLRGFGRRTEIRQEVQRQEMNLSPSVDYVQVNDRSSDRRDRYDGMPYDGSVSGQYLPKGSSPYKVVSPDDN